MYSQEAIGVLVNRIGWYPAIEPTSIVVSVENQQSLSGRYFNGFNPIAAVETIYAAIPNKDADNDSLNAELERLSNEAVFDVLQKVYKLNARATASVTHSVISTNYNSDYSESIILNQDKFDEVIGLSGAIKALEYIRTSFRSNLHSNSAKVDMGQIQEAFHGAVTLEGRVLSKGLHASYSEALGSLINVLFPIQYPNAVVIDKTSVW